MMNFKLSNKHISKQIPNGIDFKEVILETNYNKSFILSVSYNKENDVESFPLIYDGLGYAAFVLEYTPSCYNLSISLSNFQSEDEIEFHLEFVKM